jgi:hypothetical protein
MTITLPFIMVGIVGLGSSFGHSLAALLPRFARERMPGGFAVEFRQYPAKSGTNPDFYIVKRISTGRFFPSAKPSNISPFRKKSTRQFSWIENTPRWS